MNKQEALFFEALSKDRSEIADVLERRAVRGYKDQTRRTLSMSFYRMQMMHVLQMQDSFWKKID